MDFRDFKSSGGDIQAAMNVGEVTTGLNGRDPDNPLRLGNEAFHGNAGRIVRAIAPNTEASEVGLLVTLLVAFGNLAGSNCYLPIGNARHYPRLFAVLCGNTSKGRKGTSLNCLVELIRAVAQTWAEQNLAKGLSSGEGLIYNVRDEVRDAKGEVKDEGIHDKRLLVVEEEFASVLKVCKREGNPLSPIIRSAWDDGSLRQMVKNSPLKATGAHISILGHITREEVQRSLSDTEAFNGFANRFLWVFVERSQCLPFAPLITADDFSKEIGLLREAIEFSDKPRAIGMSTDFEDLWSIEYAELSEGKPGRLGAVTSRAEAQVIRLALTFALLDCKAQVNVEHLTAALELWRYCEASAIWCFSTPANDPTADQILEALKQRGSMDRTQIRDLFNRHKSAVEIETALEKLRSLKLADSTKEETDGRSREIWTATATKAT
ncbi:MAG: DUF3987 domain-containing protein [Verrucomicrobiae bacterium]|nr:DUF3987 domain-containing protein [Verrucomicrobiae bacterium]